MHTGEQPNITLSRPDFRSVGAFSTTLRASRLLRFRARQTHAAVCSRNVNQRTAGTHIEIQPARPHIALHGDWKIRLEAAPFALGLDVCRVRRRYGDVHPAVPDRYFQLPPIPNHAGQLHLHSVVTVDPLTSPATPYRENAYAAVPEV
jgi:hypothetical protein